MEIIKETTRLIVSIEELQAMGGPGVIAQTIQKALGTKGAVSVEPEPTPFQRQLPSVSGKRYVNCPRCGNRVVDFRLAVHMRSAVCQRNRKRLKEARRLGEA